MNTLTKQTCSGWLAARALSEDPYEDIKTDERLCSQFPLPKEASRQAAVVRDLIASFGSFDQALLQFRDWSSYRADEMSIIRSIRAVADTSPLLHSPGHVFLNTEKDLLTGMFSLTVFYQYTAYLFLDNGVTLLNWEGEFFDLWAPDMERHELAKEIFGAQGISCIHLNPPAGE